ncbi:MAG TPA: LysR family transcriptional regulator [Candidatus Acidoferrum sp.]|nr:LysR family transcriptional regulator [Candidatus Acidoferrum sp.]
MSIMRIEHLRQTDLNLLVVFTAVAEERNITRAASRLLLSQPAVTRALQRLRDTFHDDLLIRSPTGYELTPTGHRLLQDLATMLPRLDRLMTGGNFDPANEDATFRIAATDHAAHVLVPLLCKSVLARATRVEFCFVPLYGGQYEALEKGRLDLVLNADHDTATLHVSKEVIFEVDFVCVVSRKSKFAKAVTLKQYLAAEHVAVDIIGGVQTHPHKNLAAIGEKRRCPLVVAQHTVAMRVAAITDMIATVPRRMALLESSNKAIRILESPAALGSFKYVMIWHPRMQTDAAHVWLRSTIRELGRRLS